MKKCKTNHIEKYPISQVSTYRSGKDIYNDADRQRANIQNIQISLTNEEKSKQPVRNGQMVWTDNLKSKFNWIKKYEIILKFISS